MDQDDKVLYVVYQVNMGYKNVNIPPKSKYLLLTVLFIFKSQTKNDLS